jgi:hypothetical protein
MAMTSHNNFSLALVVLVMTSACLFPTGEMSTAATSTYVVNGFSALLTDEEVKRITDKTSRACSGSSPTPSDTSRPPIPRCFLASNPISRLGRRLTMDLEW